ncbi:MAG: hypothetical protein ACK5OB_04195 [Pirellula sp.]
MAQRDPKPVNTKIPTALERDAFVPEDPPEPKKMAGQNRFQMDESNWTDMVYNQLGGTEATFEVMFRRRVRLYLNRLEILIGMQEDVREKVLATADLEVQRFRSEIQAVLADAPKNPTQEEYQNFYQTLWQKIQPFQMRLWQGARVAGSNTTTPLWFKVLDTQLTKEHKAVLKSDERDRSAFSKDVARLDVLLQVSRRLGLTAVQRGKLESYSASHPDQFAAFETAWQVLQQLPEKTKNEMFTPYQGEQLKKPLETSDDLRPIILFGDNGFDMP